MNKMTLLLNKIERRLGTSIINLPNNLAKEQWHHIIEEDTIPTFSRYLPNAIKVLINTKETDAEGYSWVDENLPDSIKILGIRDIDWSAFGVINGGAKTPAGFGIYDMWSSQYGIDEIALLQARADITSLYLWKEATREEVLKVIKSYGIYDIIANNISKRLLTDDNIY